MSYKSANPSSASLFGVPKAFGMPRTAAMNEELRTDPDCFRESKAS